MIIAITSAANGVFLLAAAIAARRTQTTGFARLAMTSAAFGLVVLAFLVPKAQSAAVLLLSAVAAISLAVTGFVARRALRQDGAPTG